jgi:glycosyltransferase involved in cell wall biosynthesis
MKSKKPNVFLGLHEIAGYYGNLQAGLTSLGYKAQFYSFESHAFNYHRSRDKNLILILIKFLRKWNVNRPKKIEIVVLLFTLRLIRLFFYYCLCKYDVFIFGFNSRFTDYLSFKNFNDLESLKKRGKIIIYIYHGSDSRPPYMDGAIMAKSSGRTIKECVDLTKKTKRQVEEIERYADFIIDSPASGQFHTKSFINWFHIGVPYQNETKTSGRNYEERKSVRILHSPSFPEAKGSMEIERAIKSLSAKGHNLEYVCVTNKPNSVVIEEVLKADLVIDQLYSDTPMAGFATEAAFFGKPVIVGGYFNLTVANWIPKGMMPPTVYVHPDDFEAELEKLVISKELREKVGDACQKFVKERWSLDAVAKRFDLIISGNVMREWWVQPEKLDYVDGGGISNSRRVEILREMKELFGEEAFLMEDKPKLLKLLAEQASASYQIAKT